MDASGGRLTSDVVGQVEKEDGVLVIRRIHVTYRLRAEPEHEAAIQRAFEAHPPRCPVYRTLSACIEIRTALEIAAPTV